MDNSILSSVKNALDIVEDCEDFDSVLVMHINSVFFTLSQLGVGPKEGFFIKGKDEVWSDYISEGLNMEAVKSYMYLKVRLLFDPPTNSFVVTSMENQAKEYEWRLNVQAES